MKFSHFLTGPARGNGRAVLIGALTVPATALLAIASPPPGHLSWHMAAHIALMNVIAPLAALGLAHPWAGPGRIWSSPSMLWSSTLAQVAILWAIHSPSVHAAIQPVPLWPAILHLLLFAVALAFWRSVVATAHRWQAMLALLVSGKLACLLGVLLIFAPRPLFAKAAPHAAHHGDIALLADQHLAGLLMIAACPLSYVLTAVILAVQAVNTLDETRGRPALATSVGR